MPSAAGSPSIVAAGLVTGGANPFLFALGIGLSLVLGAVWAVDHEDGVGLAAGSRHLVLYAVLATSWVEGVLHPADDAHPSGASRAVGTWLYPHEVAYAVLRNLAAALLAGLVVTAVRRVGARVRRR